jgi:hypothetical protein
MNTDGGMDIKKINTSLSYTAFCRLISLSIQNKQCDSKLLSGFFVANGNNGI